MTRIPLVPISGNLFSTPPAAQPPLAFIDSEPFIIELQGSLDLPPSTSATGEMNIGKLDLSVPSKPILLIAHHRLEGSLVTLPEPFALLRSYPSSSASATKRAKLEGGEGGPKGKGVEIVALVRRKMLFKKRPEPMVMLEPSSEPDYVVT